MTYPNWFEQSHARQNFELYAPREGELICLQVGVYTGDATNWIANNMLSHPQSILWDVDTWKGSEEPVHKNMNFSEVYEEYEKKNSEFIGTKVVQYIGTSDSFFAGQPWDKPMFDFIYVDGDHTALQVMKDAINSYNSLKIGGVIAFDDYTWSLNQGEFYDPKPAIDWFKNILSDRLETIVLNGQAWFKKIK